MKQPKVVVIEWLDAHSADEWSEDLDTSLRKIHSAGYLVKETKKSVVIASMIDQKSPGTTYACVSTIPRVCIVKMKRVK